MRLISQIQTHIDKLLGIEIMLTFVQTARDYWYDVISDPWMANKMNYEKYQTRELLASVEKNIKNRFINQFGSRSIEVHTEMMAQMADFADEIRPLFDECWEKTKNAISQKMPWHQQTALLNSSMTTISIFWAEQTARMAGINEYQKIFQEILSITDSFPVRAKMEIWDDMRNIVRPEWTQPIIDKVIEICSKDTNIKNEKRAIVKEVKENPEVKLKEVCDKIFYSMQ